ncbi:MAG: 50S ribosomal protein L10 [Candidatus Hydrothermarchaeaceae archaeon]
MTKIARWKLEAVAELKGMLLEYPVVGVVDMEGMPAKQLQKIRRLLKGDTIIKMTRKSVMRHALEKAATEEKSLVVLGEHIKGQPAFIFSEINPFKLNKILVKNRASAPAKPNSIAPNDILIQKGETPFPPGPLLGEMQQVGIPTGIAGGKITVKEDKVVAREGERISPKLAEILGRLGIEPMELSLTLVAAHEAGVVFPSELLSVDEAAVVSDLLEAHGHAVNLSVNSAFLTKETAQLALAKAFSDAKGLALEAGIYEKEVIDQILSRAHAEAVALESAIREPLGAKLREGAKVEEKPAPEQEPMPEATAESEGEKRETGTPGGDAKAKREAKSDLTNIKGLGPKKAEQLKGAGVASIEDLMKTNLDELSTKSEIPVDTLKKYVADAKKGGEN